MLNTKNVWILFQHFTKGKPCRLSRPVTNSTSLYIKINYNDCILIRKWMGYKKKLQKVLRQTAGAHPHFLPEFGKVCKTRNPFGRHTLEKCAYLRSCNGLSGYIETGSCRGRDKNYPINKAYHYFWQFLFSVSVYRPDALLLSIGCKDQPRRFSSRKEADVVRLLFLLLKPSVN